MKSTRKNIDLVSINIVVWNATEFGKGKYIKPCLDSVKNQSYENIEVNIIDNASTDSTYGLIKKSYPEFNIIKNKERLGLWEAHNRFLENSRGDYVLFLSLDTILDKDFIKQAVAVFKKGKDIGGVQAKVFAYDSYNKREKVIDTVGFKMFRSRRLINNGHGERDMGQYGKEREVFAIEGAVPIFRKEAIEDTRIDGEFSDPDYVWYGEDFDPAWRMALFGWKQIYSPKVIAYHDRSTTKEISRGLLGHFWRIKERRKIPIKKRRLDWANNRFTIIKNDYIVNLIRDLPFILAREAGVFLYTLFIEPAVFLEYPRFFKLLPGMLKKRKKIMKKAKIPPSQMHRWLI